MMNSGFTQGRVVPSVVSVAVSMAGVVLLPGSVSAASRLEMIHRPLNMIVKPESTSLRALGESPGAVAPLAGVDYIARATPPVFPGDSKPLQSTSFAVSGTTAYVSYQMAGPVIHGAIDVVDLADFQNPRLVNTLFFEKDEFGDIAIAGHYAFAVGDTASGDGGSVLKVVDLADPTNLVVVASLRLGGYFANSISISGNLATISSGDNLGIVSVDISNPLSPRIGQTLALANSLDGMSMNGQVLAMGGNATTDLYVQQGGSLQWLSRIADFASPAPGKMKVSGTHLYMNPGKTGLTVLDLASPSGASHVYHGQLAGTGNGLDVLSSYAFLAQGEDGVHVVDVTRPAEPLALGSVDFGDDSGSANTIKSAPIGSNNVVLLGDGLGGFKILGFRAGLPMKATRIHCWFIPDQVDVKNLRGGYTFNIPAELPVTRGNAAQGHATLTFDDVTCRYKGVTECPFPLPFTKDWARGKKYVFESCSNGAKAGETISAKRDVHLKVNEGSWFFSPKTRAEVTLEVQLN